jgi:hypothetical protein
MIAALLLMCLWISMRYFALLSIVLLSFAGHATTQVDLYRSEVVLGQDQNDEGQARIRGMETVIVKATGDKNSVNNPVIKKALTQSGQYISQVGYGQQGEQKTLKMTFNAQQIRTLLTQAQLRFWPANRTTILMWFVQDQGLRRSIEWENVSSPAVERLKQLADKRGLPLIVPVGDFDDITGIEVSDVWGGFLQPISRASRRYSPDAVLVVRAQNQDLRWTLFDQTPEKMTNFASVPLSGVLSGDNAAQALIDHLAQYYARKNGAVVSSQSSQSILVKVTQLTKAVPFFSLEQSLENLSSVASIDILSIQGRHVLFRVHLLTTQQEFEQEVSGLNMIEKDDAMSLMPPSTNQIAEGPSVPDPIKPATPTTLVYRWKE